MLGNVCVANCNVSCFADVIAGVVLAEAASRVASCITDPAWFLLEYPELPTNVVKNATQLVRSHNPMDFLLAKLSDREQDRLSASDCSGSLCSA